MQQEEESKHDSKASAPMEGSIKKIDKTSII